MTDFIGEFRIDVERSNGRPPSVVVIGELDLATADQLETALRELATEVHGVVVDLSSCSFVDSSGLRAILVAAKLFEGRDRDGAAPDRDGAAPAGRRATRGCLVIAAPRPSVQRVLEISGVDQGVPVFATRSDALEAVAAD
ncbi:MAG TPA: STAS domain-containing protein [Solirubrobacterales bacterium]|jgi:anti-anti-sigma regulatory factor|nr:STAS domain-containing protein [Solirubrobacterales bacterium]